MTENLNLQRGLLKNLSQIPEVQLLDNVRVTAIEKEGGANGWPLVRLSNGQTFRARLLVSLGISYSLPWPNQPQGWCRWAKFSCSRIRRNHEPWVGLRHPRCRCYPFTCPSRTVPTPEYHRLPTFPTHRTHRVPSPLSNRIVNGLVDQASVGRCVEKFGALHTCELRERCFSLARSFDPPPT